ncbi:ATP-binding SpoIIE family protein phosphatase [Streptomyces griseus]|uniref:ATP-binding SpoIIE family protein phosphatase n=1 Tax=Streptomyces griseus TaxID=1911 RepID=UPI00056C2066|nr:ATP-binding SpoIIE family protein phosphatase [Streptomyces griseus]
MSRVWDIPVHDPTRVRDVRVAVEAACARARLDPSRADVATLVGTELATNLVKHAYGGRVVIDLVDGPASGTGPRRSSVQILSLDHGPGIADVAAALSDGHSTVDGSLGAGLGTCRRIANDFDLHSVRGRGTVAVARVDHEPPARSQARHRHQDGPRAGGANLPLARDEYSGDGWSWVRYDSLVTLMLADGLGHGAKAAHASDTAVRELHRAAHLPPADILRRLHTALRPTRGAAVAVAQVDMSAEQLCFSGVGNIGARLHGDGGWRSLVSRPGIVGAHFPATVHVTQLPWRADTLLVLHSDGLPSRWTPPDEPDLLTHAPAVVAAAVLRDASSAARPLRDDTSVAVLAPDRRTRAHDRRT